MITDILIGFQCQGCEISEYMLLGSDWVLNRCIEEMDIFPFIHQRINLKSHSDIVKHVVIPDEIPSFALQDLTTNDNNEVPFSMIAGDFISCYSQPSEESRLYL